MLTGNKGEWSEIYTLLRLIADGVLLKGDSHLRPIPGERYKIITLERNETIKGVTTYSIDDESVVIRNTEKTVTLSRNIFSDKANQLLESIQTQSGTIQIPSIEAFMSDMLTFSIKAKSLDKSDINVEIFDHRSSMQRTRGFSIKSQLGSPSTLLNASQQTIFRYRLNNISSQEVERINSIKGRSALIKRVSEITGSGSITVASEGSTSETLSYNLRLMDDALPDIVSSLLWRFYAHNTSKLDKLVDYVAEDNIRSYGSEGRTLLYAAKLKRLLVSSALGMLPSQRWNGNYDANGGYLIVLDTGEVISYHIFDKEEFENYLFHNTKLDTPSTSRYSTGEILNDEEGYFIDLGLQIRFCV